MIWVVEHAILSKNDEFTSRVGIYGQTPIKLHLRDRKPYLRSIIFAIRSIYIGTV